jgi:hypothetical protein
MLGTILWMYSVMAIVKTASVSICIDRRSEKACRRLNLSIVEGLLVEGERLNHLDREAAGREGSIRGLTMCSMKRTKLNDTVLLLVGQG